MSSLPGNLRFTYQDYLLTPEDRRYELIDGELYMTPAPIPFHQILVMRLSEALNAFAREHGLGQVIPAPCDVYFSRHDVVQPDILYIATSRLGIVQERYIQGAPDLVVEILSPGNIERDRELKFVLYSRYGVREYWIVDPQSRCVELFTRQQAELRIHRTFLENETLETELFPGFRLPLAPVFAKLV